jgi:hypothetical protein
VQSPRSSPDEDNLGGIEEPAGRAVVPTSPSWPNGGRIVAGRGGLAIEKAAGEPGSRVIGSGTRE